MRTVPTFPMLALVCLLLICQSCSKPQDETATGTDNNGDKLTIAGIVFQEDQFFRLVQFGMRDAARRADVELIHESRGLLGFFQFVLTIEDYQHPKPDPDPYLAALERFGARPDQAVVIEDSARGLRSALDAGLDCVVVRSAFTASQDFTGAWRVVDSIREVPEILTA